MNSIFDGIYILIILQVSFSLVAYIKFKLSGLVISRHRFYKPIVKQILIVIITVVLSFMIVKIRLNIYDFYGAFFVGIYMMISIYISNVDIFVTANGYYYSGKYIKWDDVVLIHDDNSHYLVIEKVAMVRSKQKIKDLQNKKVFLEIANNNRITKS